jgi:hypothetical protein
MMTCLWFFKDVFQINMGNGHSHDAHIELKNDGALDIYQNTFVITLF